MGSARTLQHRKQDFVRGAIWDAAVDLFVDKGFEQTTVDEIARAAGVSRRSFFRYFSSKNDLMAQGMVTYGAQIADAIAGCPSPAPLAVVGAAVRQVAAGAAAHPRVRKIAHVAGTSRAAREAQLSRVAELEDRVADAFRARLRRRDDLTPRLLAGLTLAILDVTFREWLKRDDPDILHTADQVFAALRGIVCAAPPRRSPPSPAAVAAAERRTRLRGA